MKSDEVILLANGRVWRGVDPDREDAAVKEAMVVGGGRVLAVGTTDDLRARYPHARSIDLEGRTVIPGLIDAHNHAARGVVVCVDQTGDDGAALEIDAACMGVSRAEVIGGSDREHPTAADHHGFLHRGIFTIGVHTAPHPAVREQDHLIAFHAPVTSPGDRDVLGLRELEQALLAAFRPSSLCFTPPDGALGSDTFPRLSPTIPTHFFVCERSGGVTSRELRRMRRTPPPSGRRPSGCSSRASSATRAASR